MAGGRPGASPAEAELWRLLSHARSCDGLKPNASGKLAACETCIHIDRWLEDGATYFADDPVLRIATLDKALVAVMKQAERISGALEGSVMPASTRNAAVQLVEWLEKTRRILTLPITDFPGYEPPVKPTTPVVPDSGRTRVRTAVVLDFLTTKARSSS